MMGDAAAKVAASSMDSDFILAIGGSKTMESMESMETVDIPTKETRVTTTH